MENIELKSSALNSLTLRNVTGKLMFKFDDDEPQELATICDYGRVTIEIQQNKKGNDNIIHHNTTLISFKSKNGKEFKLYIDDVRDDKNNE